jgi:hypothetical protein
MAVCGNVVITGAGHRHGPADADQDALARSNSSVIAANHESTVE